MLTAQKIMCKQLKSKNLPCINFRVSADYGSVITMNTTDSTSIDMIGPPVNMCSIINRCANKNEYVISGDLFEIVKRLDDYTFQETTCYNIGMKHSYPVYKVIIQ